MLAGCAKSEVNPVSEQDNEISYQTVIGPKTKAHSEFDGANVFASYAYFLGKDKTWNADKEDASLYINNATISKVDNVWKDAARPYYWPKDGSLTFFAWSFNSSDLTLGEGAALECNTTDGIKVTGYDATKNLNKDFMVADIAADKSQNVKTYYTEGVPTLFRHKLCQVAYSVKAKAEYTGVTFQLKSLSFSSIAQSGDYVQLPADSEGWTAENAEETYTFTSSVNVQGFDNTTAAVSSEGGDQNYFIPQELASAKVSITYDIITAVEGGTTSTETVTVETELNGESLFKDGWKMNTKYTLNITVGLDEILWDPAVEDWTEADGSWSLEN